VARPKLGEGAGHLIFLSEDMVELEAVEFLLQLPNLLLVCVHARVMAVQLSHNLVDDELRFFTDVKPPNPKFSDDTHTVD
jgi:hypothetical protein